MRSVLFLITVYLFICFQASAQTKPSFAIIGTKEKIRWVISTRCLYVQAVNYDITNPEHFELIRQYICAKGDDYPDDTVHIYIFNSEQEMEYCECGDSNNVQNPFLLARAELQPRAPEHDFQRQVLITPNSRFRIDAGSDPVGVNFYRSGEDRYWY